jgi:hypothetical protein
VSHDDHMSSSPKNLLIYTTSRERGYIRSQNRIKIHVSYYYIAFLLDCWFWIIPKSSKWRPLHITWREDSSQVDSSGGPSLSQVLHCQWCLELWLPPLWDMVTGVQAISWSHQCPGKGIAKIWTTFTCYLELYNSNPTSGPISPCVYTR